MTPDELAEKLDRALEQALTLCSNPKEYTDLLKVAVEWYSQRQVNAGGKFGAALTKGATNGG